VQIALVTLSVPSSVTVVYRTKHTSALLLLTAVLISQSDIAAARQALLPEKIGTQTGLVRTHTVLTYMSQTLLWFAAVKYLMSADWAGGQGGQRAVDRGSAGVQDETGEEHELLRDNIHSNPFVSPVLSMTHALVSICQLPVPRPTLVLITACSTPEDLNREQPRRVGYRRRHRPRSLRTS